MCVYNRPHTVVADLDEKSRIIRLRPLIESLPPPNRESLKHLMMLCAEIVKHVDKNKMNAANLATVLGPTSSMHENRIQLR
jgi:hypothetical protein